MEPHDEPSMEPSTADSDADGAPPAPASEEALSIEPEVGAALLLSGNYSRSLADRVFSGLTPEEMIRLSHGMLKLKATPEDRMERMWNRLTLLFTGDWREEDDLVEFIRAILRRGIRQDPPLTPMQKTALLLLSLPEDVAPSITSALMSGLERGAVNELARELAHLIHYPNPQVHERVLGEFLAFASARAAQSTVFMGVAWMEQEVERLVRRDITSCADVAQRLWLLDGELLATLHDAARQQPERLLDQIRQFVRGGTRYAFIPAKQRVATFRACLSAEAARSLDVALKMESDALPEAYVSPARKTLVLREFLHRYYFEYMNLVPIVLQ